MNEAQLRDRLARTFAGSRDECHIVTRQIIDLQHAGRYRESHSRELTVDHIIDELQEAPDGSLVERWNWWIGALELAHGGFRQFRVDRWEARNAEDSI